VLVGGILDNLFAYVLFWTREFRPPSRVHFSRYMADAVVWGSVLRARTYLRLGGTGRRTKECRLCNSIILQANPAVNLTPPSSPTPPIPVLDLHR
jgi:hypothetical protein